MDFKNCPKCTGEVQPAVNFCPKCGHDFALTRSKPPAPSALEAGVGTAQAVMAVLLIIFGILGGLYTCS